MPFADCAARSFSIASIQKNAPESSGVYGLSNGREWLFIGEGNNIRQHLLEHAKEAGTVLKVQHPTGFSFELCSAGERTGRLNTLVSELGPRFNRRMG